MPELFAIIISSALSLINGIILIIVSTYFRREKEWKDKVWGRLEMLKAKTVTIEKLGDTIDEHIKKEYAVSLVEMDKRIHSTEAKIVRLENKK